MATDCSSIDLSALVNAAQSAAKDLGYKNPKEQQLEAIVYTNISFHVSKMAVEESLHKCLLVHLKSSILSTAKAKNHSTHLWCLINNNNTFHSAKHHSKPNLYSILMSGIFWCQPD